MPRLAISPEMEATFTIRPDRLLHHLAADDLRASKRACDVEIELRPPCIGRHFFGWHIEAPAADVIDEDIDWPVLGDRTQRRLLCLFRYREVTDERADIRAEGRGFRRGGIERDDLATHEHEVGTRLGKPKRNLLPRTTTAAGYQRPAPC